MKLVKKANAAASEIGRTGPAGAGLGTIDRRTFLKQSGVAAGGIAALGSLPLSMMQRAEASAEPPAGIESDVGSTERQSQVERSCTRRFESSRFSTESRSSCPS